MLIDDVAGLRCQAAQHSRALCVRFWSPARLVKGESRALACLPDGALLFRGRRVSAPAEAVRGGCVRSRRHTSSARRAVGLPPAARALLRLLSRRVCQAGAAGSMTPVYKASLSIARRARVACPTRLRLYVRRSRVRLSARLVTKTTAYLGVPAVRLV